MNRITCPHCGMQNFAISAYCSRCERPLPRDAKAGADGLTAAPPHRPPRSAPARPPQRAAVPRSSRPPTASAAKLSLPAVPPPPPPVVTEITPAELPIELATLAQPAVTSPVAETAPATESFAELPEAVEPDEHGLDATEVTEAASGLLEDGARIDVPVKPASVRQVWLALWVDLTVVLAGGLAVMAAASFLFGHWPRFAGLPLDGLADWLNADLRPALAGAVAMVLGGPGYAALAGRRGRTLGRRLTGTILVRVSGRRLTWGLLAIRAVFSLLSFACCGAGFYWTIVDRWHRPWHDVWCGTVLVSRRVRFD
jgi:uncharacterized RDD family membrane protein YckC